VDLVVLVRVMSAAYNSRIKWCNCQRRGEIVIILCGEKGRHGGDKVITACGGEICVRRRHSIECAVVHDRCTFEVMHNHDQ
jgi:hypothetical protein